MAGLGESGSRFPARAGGGSARLTRQGLDLVLAAESQQPWNSSWWLRGPKGTVPGLVVEGSYLGRGTGGGSRRAGPA